MMKILNKFSKSVIKKHISVQNKSQRGVFKTRVMVSYMGQFDISRHCETKGHLKNVELLKAASSTPSIVNFMPSKSATPNQLAVVKAETMFSEMILIPLT